jgi:hypothetical protein
VYPEKAPYSPYLTTATDPEGDYHAEAPATILLGPGRTNRELPGRKVSVGRANPRVAARVGTGSLPALAPDVDSPGAEIAGREDWPVIS